MIEGSVLARELAGGPRRSIPRIVLDLVLWVAAVTLSERAASPWAACLAVLWIGAGPMHDLLVHGHEGTHGLISRNGRLNEVFTWLTHALVGLSGTAYRAFHLAHHRWVGTDRDPEYRVLDRVARGVPGWAYLGIPAIAHWLVNVYPFRDPATRTVRVRVARDLLGMLVLHAGLVLALGTARYLTYVAAPIFTSLAAAVIVRSVAEHHATRAGDPWTETRTVESGPFVRWLWSNTGYHLEHHLFPFVPYHRLPVLHRRLAPELDARRSPVDRGFLRTALRLLGERAHFQAPPSARAARSPALVDDGSLAYRMKVRWFADILGHPAARRHLWSLYYAGEAYQELHAQGVFVEKLGPPLSMLLARHLRDETRHAEVFRDLLAEQGLAPAPLPPEEDVGWYLLTHVVPDVVLRSGEPRPFTADEAGRYLAFLHLLELRSLSDLSALIDAARSRGEDALADRLAAIRRDERFHASYTHSAVVRLAGDRRRARAVLDAIRRAERRHYSVVLRALLRRFEALGTAPAGLAGRVRWRVLKLAAALGLAVPLLPVFDRLPVRLLRDGNA